MQVAVTSFQGRSITHACSRQLKLQVALQREGMVWVSVVVRDGRWGRAGGGRCQVEVVDGFWS